MTLTVEAIYEDGVLKPATPLPLKEHEKVSITIRSAVGLASRTAGMVPWTGSLEDLDFLISDAENDPLEAP
jgi:predicted DNA-binding antitoxin AbrB/MazE fold protein